MLYLEQKGEEREVYQRKEHWEGPQKRESATGLLNRPGDYFPSYVIEKKKMDGPGLTQNSLTFSASGASCSILVKETEKRGGGRGKAGQPWSRRGGFVKELGPSREKLISVRSLGHRRKEVWDPHPENDRM